jgi:hypothetical protein
MEDIRYIQQKKVSLTPHHHHHCLAPNQKTLFLLGTSHIDVYDLSFQSASKIATFSYDGTDAFSSCTNEDGSLLCVGDPSHDNGNGRVLVYTSNETKTNWTLSQTIVCNPPKQSYFGWSLCCDYKGEKLFIGTNIHHYLKSDVYKYEKNTDNAFVKDVNFNIKPYQQNQLLSNFGTSLKCCPLGTTLVVLSDHVSMKKNNTNVICRQIQIFKNSSQGWKYDQEIMTNEQLSSTFVFTPPSTNSTNHLLFFCNGFIYVYISTNQNAPFVLKDKISTNQKTIQHMYVEPSLRYVYIQKENKEIIVYNGITQKKEIHPLPCRPQSMCVNQENMICIEDKQIMFLWGKYKRPLRHDQKTTYVMKTRTRCVLPYAPKQIIAHKSPVFFIDQNELDITKPGTGSFVVLFQENKTYYETKYTVQVVGLHQRYTTSNVYKFIKSFYNTLRK